MSPTEHQKFTRFAPIAVMGLIALLGGVFVTVLTSQQSQNLRSRADYNGTVFGNYLTVNGNVTGNLVGNYIKVSGNVNGCVIGNFNTVGGRVYGSIIGNGNTAQGGSAGGSCGGGTVAQPTAKPVATATPVYYPPTPTPTVYYAPTPTKTPTPTVYYAPTATPVPYNATVSVSPSSVIKGATVTVNWSGVGSPTAKDWIGFISATGTLDENPFVYTSSCSTTIGSTLKASGSCTMASPPVAGVYTVKLLKDDSFVQIASGNTLTVTESGYPTPTTYNAPTPTKTPTPVYQPTATPGYQPTATPYPVATLAQGQTGVSLTLALHGLGKGGDNANPNGSGTANPLRPQRNVTLDVFNASNAIVKTVQGTVAFDSASGLFKGTINLGSDLSSGTYTMRVKTDQFLRSLVPGIQNLTSGQTADAPKTAMVNGDINNDNTVNILDYNILTGCYSDLNAAVNCAAGDKAKADITDDGSVNFFDYNLFLRELSNRGGQ